MSVQAITGLLITALGVLPALSTDLLGLMDKIAGELLLVAGALATAILAGWVARDEIQSELIQGASAFWARQVPKIMAVLRFVVPLLVAALAGHHRQRGDDQQRHHHCHDDPDDGGIHSAPSVGRAWVVSTVPLIAGARPRPGLNGSHVTARALRRACPRQRAAT